MPIETSGEIPFVGLCKFIPHKQKFRTGMREHIRVKRTKIGKFLPFISRHFINQTRFSVYHLIVRKWHHIIFIIHVHRAKGQFVVVVFSVNGVFLEIFQRVVHPSHHPFHSESNAAVVNGFCEHRKV